MRCQLVATAALAAAGAGCSIGGQSAVDIPIERGEPVYYLGESFEGLPLTHVEVEDGRAFLVYGDCEPRSDAGCSPPLQLQESYPPVGDLQRDVTCPPAGRPKRADDPHSIVVFAGPTTITIYASATRARRAAAALRPAPGACGEPSR